MKEENLFDMNVEEKRLKTFKKWIFKEPMLCTKEKEVITVCSIEIEYLDPYFSYISTRAYKVYIVNAGFSHNALDE
ncbi:hypothetical protein Avbf_10557 [Armadillidium vulgare]|nr:hypothetical protein Avbf_10557 [Armadillidium vulgare]